ncbi:FAD/NAD(P)-binding domain-containing protein [Mycena sanguinolenta]|uniref:FAD/NAD(P)-binding domain-containing protein n=1 Tax=Mycena sanguinolenta TaxID=230812 RepID=A0A8H6ZDN3_9AGAR|nr:FAD/NAD(P)-binding domain-containing protein [Mycena sanguinolenta]
MAHEDSPRPLTVSVVGAGIGGLAAAVALQIGAGIGVQVNALRVLEHLGASRENLKGVSYEGITIFDSKTGEGVARRWLLPDMDQNRSLSCHRSDVHDELMRLAVGEGEGHPIELRLGSRVVDCSPEDGTVTLEGGQVIQADLVIGADGLHSTIRTTVLGHPQKATASGFSCFRSVIDASKLRDISDTDWFTGGLPGMKSLYDKEGDYRLAVMYLCRGGSLINLVALYSDPHQDDPGQHRLIILTVPTSKGQYFAGWSPVGTREELLQTFQTFHPKFVELFSLADSPILRWQLRVLPVLDTWIRGRAALLGDAAHATLPTLGQGAAAAIEEAGALGCLLPLGTRREDVPSRLEAYQAVRKPRGDYINREALEQAIDPSKRGLYLRSLEVQTYLLGHNAIRDAQEYYEKHFK